MREDPRVTIDTLLSQQCALLRMGWLISIYILTFLFNRLKMRQCVASLGGAELKKQKLNSN